LYLPETGESGNKQHILVLGKRTAVECCSLLMFICNLTYRPMLIHWPHSSLFKDQDRAVVYLRDSETLPSSFNPQNGNFNILFQNLKPKLPCGWYLANK